MSTFQVEMLWRCATCKTENLGRHKNCQNCGKPKEREKFYDAPGPVTRSAAVTDPKLLEQALAGHDWECPYCHSHQRRDSGECANCGAGVADPLASVAYKKPRHRRSAPSRQDASINHRKPMRRSRAALLTAVGMATILSLVLWLLFVPKVVDATVVSKHWTHTVHVERNQVVSESGFDPARDGFDVLPAGTRVHHHRQVQDGYRTESYQESYSCGQTCRPIPVTCSSNDNGFKTCSGGGESCSPKTCYRTKTRQVPKYRDEPVYQPWYRWKAWRWRHNRDVSDSGSFNEPTWPSKKRVALAPKERASRSAAYVVTFRDTDNESYEYKPRDLAEFKSIHRGAQEKLRVGVASSVLIERRPHGD